MGQVAFSKDFNMLRSAQWHSAIKTLHDGMAMLGPLTPIPWLMCLGSDIPMGSARDFKTMVRSCFVSLLGYIQDGRRSEQGGGFCPINTDRCRLPSLGKEKLTAKFSQTKWAAQQMDDRMMVQLLSPEYSKILSH